MVKDRLDDTAGAHVLARTVILKERLQVGARVLEHLAADLGFLLLPQLGERVGLLLAFLFTLVLLSWRDFVNTT